MAATRSGAGGVPLARFLPICAAAAAAWALITGLEYYWFGNALARADTWVQVVLVLIGILWLVLAARLLQRRVLRGLPGECDRRQPITP